MILHDKVAIVTGSASGIGRATAHLLAAEGASVVVADLDDAGASAVVSEIEADGGKAIATQVDVSAEDDVREMIATAVSTFGGLDVLHNNAAALGSASPGLDMDIANMDVDVWDRTMAVNLRGVMLGCKHAIPALLERGGGAIVNTASIAGLQGLVSPITMHAPEATMIEGGGIAYIASKHAVVGMTAQYAIAFAERGVRVNAVAPGYIETPMTEILREDMQIQHEYEQLHPMARLGQPDEIATAVVFLSSDAASFITGHTLPVDGGYSCR